MRIAILSVFFLLTATALQAQEISPVIQECGHAKCSTFMQVRNSGITSLVVTFEAYQFDFKDKKQVFHSPDSNIRVKLSATSLVLPPQATKMLDISIDCRAESRCNIEIMSHISGKRTAEGLHIYTELGEAIYVCQNKAAGCRKSVLTAAGIGQ